MSDDPNMEQPTIGSLLGNLYHAENAMLLLVHGTNILESSEKRRGEMPRRESTFALGLNASS
jgi:hypothetical protein